MGFKIRCAFNPNDTVFDKKIDFYGLKPEDTLGELKRQIAELI